VQTIIINYMKSSLTFYKSETPENNRLKVVFLHMYTTGTLQNEFGTIFIGLLSTK
jgi:hypothetical protein